VYLRGMRRASGRRCRATAVAWPASSSMLRPSTS